MLIIINLFSHESERDSLDENALNNEEIINESNTNERPTEDKPYYIQPRVASISRFDILILVFSKRNLFN